MYETDRLTHEMFTSGDCWVLARTLRARTGWDYVFAMNHLTDKEEGWSHAAVITPTGEVIDINGAHTDREEWGRGWGAERVLVTREPLHFDCLDPMWDDDYLSSEVASLEVADDLIGLAST